jgi:hypothetical protein
MALTDNQLISEISAYVIGTPARSASSCFR